MKPVVLGIGELLWDLLPAGPQVGGAPANFARHAQALGAVAHVISRVGDDPLGHGLIDNVRNSGLDATSIQIDVVHPTGTVTVEVDADGQPRFTIHENVAWDHLEATPASLDLARQADALCFGSLAQRSASSRAAIRQLIAAAPDHALRIFDMNLRQHYPKIRSWEEDGRRKRLRMRVRGPGAWGRKAATGGACPWSGSTAARFGRAIAGALRRLA